MSIIDLTARYFPIISQVSSISLQYMSPRMINLCTVWSTLVILCIEIHNSTKTVRSCDAPIRAEVGGAEKKRWGSQPITHAEIESDRVGAFFIPPRIH